MRFDDDAAVELRARVLDHIDSIAELFPATRRSCLSGGCHALAAHLVDVFGGEIMLDAHRDHAVARIGGRIYDITGSISDKRAGEFHVASESETRRARRWIEDARRRHRAS